MKLAEALKIVKTPGPQDVPPLRVYLACGFQPAHLELFFAAHLRNRFPGRPVEVRLGLYGDPTGNLQRIAAEPLDAAAVVLEWSDFDPRLGLRGQCRWSTEVLADVQSTFLERADQIVATLKQAGGPPEVAVCLPTLPLLPMSHCPSQRSGAFDSALRAAAASLAESLSRLPNVAIVNPGRLDQLSPPAERLDVNSELSCGLPYSKFHASAVAELLVELLYPAAPKKGLITDLDDTLWRGILGEDGVESVSWDLDHHSRMHGLYQQLLDSLAASGVFLGVASKNDPRLVAEALKRSDLLLDPDKLFPIEAHWGQKSESVARILRAWNVGAESVVFVDDSPMELDLVKSRFPQIETVLFPTGDNQGIYGLLGRLRDLFGKAKVEEEDLLRVKSVQNAGTSPAELAEPGEHFDSFLQRAEARLTLSYALDPDDSRAFELVNKTNQFNLNGVRYTRGEWHARLKQPGGFLVVASYRDKFGPLGKIAVLLGNRQGDDLRLETWVMSCRAFGRRIEHACLKSLLDRFAAETVTCRFKSTPRNAPLREFLESILQEDPREGLTIAREQFAACCPPLYQEVQEIENA